MKDQPHKCKTNNAETLMPGLWSPALCVDHKLPHLLFQMLTLTRKYRRLSLFLKFKQEE